MNQLKIVICFALFLIILSYGALAASSSLNLITANAIQSGDKTITAGVTPDSSLYFLDVALDDIRLFLTFDELQKSKLALNIARERLLETKEMIKINRLDDAQTSQQEYRKAVNTAKSIMDLNRTDKSQQLKDITEVEKEIELLDDEVEKISDEIMVKTKMKGGGDETAINNMLGSLEDTTTGLKTMLNNKKTSTMSEMYEAGKSQGQIEKEVEDIENAYNLSAVKEEKASEKINDAKEEIVALSNMLNQPDLSAEDRNNAKALLQQASEHLAKAENALENLDSGEAYGRANSALQLAENAKKALSKLSEVKPKPEIEIEIKENSAKVRIKVNDNEAELISPTTNQEEIIADTAERMGMTEEEVSNITTIVSEEDVKLKEDATEKKIRILTGKGYAPDEILVSFKSDTTKAAQEELKKRYSMEEKDDKNLEKLGIKSLKVDPDSLDAITEALNHNPKVEFAEKDYIAEAMFIPNDPYLGQQWAPRKIQATDAWNITKGNSNIRIAILDTGIQMNHSDLASKIVSCIDFTTSPTCDYNGHNHGTHCAGIAAAITNNSIGVAGICPECSLMNVKVLGDDGYGSYSWISNGIIWAADNGANVISMSLGGSSSSSTIENAVNYAWNKGAVVVAASGNSGSTSATYPAYYANCIAVGATDQIDLLCNFANRGSWVDVAAPGNAIYSTIPNGTYGYKSGTSMATPHVAGLAGLVFSMIKDTNGNGKLNDEVRYQIESTADNKGSYNISGGRINAYRAVANITAPPVTTTTTTTTTTSSTTSTSSTTTTTTSVTTTTISPTTSTTLPTTTTTLLTTTTSTTSSTTTTTTTSTTTTTLPSSDTIPPTVSINSPLDGSTVSGTVNIKATASDNVAVKSMELYIDGKLLAFSQNSTITYAWNTKPKKVASGPHEIKIKAYDAPDNIGSASITVSKR